MSKKKNPGNTKKKLSLYPKGRPKDPILFALTTQKHATKTDMKGYAAMCLNGNYEQLVQYADLHNDGPMLLKIIANSILQGMEDKAPIKFQWILDRIWGKPKETVDMTLQKPTVIEKLDGSEVILGSEPIDVTDT